MKKGVEPECPFSIRVVDRTVASRDQALVAGPAAKPFQCLIRKLSAASVPFLEGVSGHNDEIKSLV